MSRPALVRSAGLAGSVLLAVAAYAGGADRPWQPTMTPGTVLAGQSGLLAPLTWLLGTVLLTGAWWYGRTVVPSARWAYLTAALWVLPLLPVLPLGSYDVYSYACQGHALAAGLDPYAAGVQALGCPWLDAVSPTWRDAPAPYGPVFLLIAAAASALGGSLAGVLAALRVVSVLGVVLIAVSLPALTRRTGVDLKRAVWLALACPLVAVHLVSGAHNDAVMVGLLVAGLAVAARGRAAGPLLAAGALLGLAVGVKATALVVLPFAVLAAARAGRPDPAVRDPAVRDPAVREPAVREPAVVRWGTLVRPAVLVGGGALAVLAGVSLASGLGFGWIRGLTGSGASVQWTSPSTAVGMTVNLAGQAFGAGWEAVPVTRVLGIAVLVAVLIALCWRARRSDALLGAGLALAATVALAPVFHPWYLTWPLAVLAATQRRDTRWLVLPCAVAGVLCLPDGYNLALAVKTQGAVAMTALVVVLLVRRGRRP
ncbi:polyprenol phosphomannose-dependent alpha 1,6 mannosyltransferase MptB [Jidongwangia harbinensis]|uniref:polyprenol phosphomannose-dependent alpha 1,6 mannosyltransferase MptB n=1 Tax=Jidongwangia harbinensis TaxID=2878561 RepID=UPI0021044F11|nr:polyprenol phosphomannose-dependent alpha 1,6 mannosyltransferase MptB [Jidongwangia harbinensis]